MSTPTLVRLLTSNAAAGSAHASSTAAFAQAGATQPAQAAEAHAAASSDASSAASASGSASTSGHKRGVSLNSKWKVAAATAGRESVASSKAKREAAAGELLLRRFPCLANVSRASLATLLRTTRTRTFSSRPATAADKSLSNILVREGEQWPGNDPVLLLIASGSVDLYMRSPFLDGTRQRHPQLHLARLGRGDEINAYAVAGKSVEQTEMEHVAKRISFEPSPYTIVVSPNSEHKDEEAAPNASSGPLKAQSAKAATAAYLASATPHQHLQCYSLSLLAFRNLLCSQPMLYEEVQGDILGRLAWRTARRDRSAMSHTSVGGFSEDRTPFGMVSSRGAGIFPEQAALLVRELSPPKQQSLSPNALRLKSPSAAVVAAQSAPYELHHAHRALKFTHRQLQDSHAGVGLPSSSVLARILSAPETPSPAQVALNKPPALFSFEAMMGAGAKALAKIEEDAAAARAMEAQQLASSSASSKHGRAKTRSSAARPDPSASDLASASLDGPLDLMAVDTEELLVADADVAASAASSAGYLAQHKGVAGKYVSPEESQLRKYLEKQRLARSAAEAKRAALEEQKYRHDLEQAVRQALQRGLNAPAPPSTPGSGGSSSGASITSPATSLRKSVSIPTTDRSASSSRRHSPNQGSGDGGSGNATAHALSAANALAATLSPQLSRRLSTLNGGVGPAPASPMSSKAARLLDAALGTSASSSRQESQQNSPRSASAAAAADGETQASDAQQLQIPSPAPSTPTPMYSTRSRYTISPFENPLGLDRTASVRSTISGAVAPSPHHGLMMAPPSANLLSPLVSSGRKGASTPSTTPSTPSITIRTNTSEPEGAPMATFNLTASPRPEGGPSISTTEWPNYPPPFRSGFGSPTAVPASPQAASKPAASSSASLLQAPSALEMISSPGSTVEEAAEDDDAVPEALTFNLGHISDGDETEDEAAAAIAEADQAPGMSAATSLLAFQNDAANLLARAQARAAHKAKQDRRVASKNANARIAAMRAASGQGDISAHGSVVDGTDGSGGGVRRHSLMEANGLITRRFSRSINHEMFSASIKSAIQSGIGSIGSGSGSSGGGLTASKLAELNAAAAVNYNQAKKRKQSIMMHLSEEAIAAATAGSPAAAALAASAAARDGSPSPDGQRRHSTFLNHSLHTKSHSRTLSAESSSLVSGSLPTAQKDDPPSASTIEELFHLKQQPAGGDAKRRQSVFKATPYIASAAEQAAQAAAAAAAAVVPAGPGGRRPSAMLAPNPTSSVPLFTTPTRNSNGSILVNTNPGGLSYAEFFSGALNVPEQSVAAAQAIASGVRPELVHANMMQRMRGVDAKRLSLALGTTVAANRRGSVSQGGPGGGGAGASANQRMSLSVGASNSPLLNSPVNLLGFISSPGSSALTSPVNASSSGNSAGQSAASKARISFSFGSGLPASLIPLTEEQLRSFDESDDDDDDSSSSADSSNPTSPANASAVPVRRNSTSKAFFPASSARSSMPLSSLHTHDNVINEEEAEDDASTARSSKPARAQSSGSKPRAGAQATPAAISPQATSPVAKRKVLHSSTSAPVLPTVGSPKGQRLRDQALSPTLQRFELKGSNFSPTNASRVTTTTTTTVGAPSTLAHSQSEPEFPPDLSLPASALAVRDSVEQKPAAAPEEEPEPISRESTLMPKLPADHRVAGILAPTGSRLGLNTLHAWSASDWMRLKDRVRSVAQAEAARGAVTLSDIFQFQGLENDPAAIQSGLGLADTIGTRASSFLDLRGTLAGLGGKPSTGIHALSIILHSFCVQHPVFGTKPPRFKLRREMSGEAVQAKKERARSKIARKLDRIYEKRLQREAEQQQIADEEQQLAEGEDGSRDAVDQLDAAEATDEFGATATSLQLVLSQDESQQNGANITPLISGRPSIIAEEAARSRVSSAGRLRTSSSHGRLLTPMLGSAAPSSARAAPSSARGSVPSSARNQGSLSPDRARKGASNLLASPAGAPPRHPHSLHRKNHSALTSPSSAASHSRVSDADPIPSAAELSRALHLVALSDSKLVEEALSQFCFFGTPVDIEAMEALEAQQKEEAARYAAAMAQTEAEAKMAAEERAAAEAAAAKAAAEAAEAERVILEAKQLAESERLAAAAAAAAAEQASRAASTEPSLLISVVGPDEAEEEEDEEEDLGELVPMNYDDESDDEEEAALSEITDAPPPPLDDDEEAQWQRARDEERAHEIPVMSAEEIEAAVIGVIMHLMEQTDADNPEIDAPIALSIPIPAAAPTDSLDSITEATEVAESGAGADAEALDAALAERTETAAHATSSYVEEPTPSFDEYGFAPQTPVVTGSPTIPAAGAHVEGHELCEEDEAAQQPDTATADTAADPSLFLPEAASDPADASPLQESAESEAVAVVGSDSARTLASQQQTPRADLAAAESARVAPPSASAEPEPLSSPSPRPLPIVSSFVPSPFRSPSASRRRQKQLDAAHAEAERLRLREVVRNAGSMQPQQQQPLPSSSPKHEETKEQMSEPAIPAAASAVSTMTPRRNTLLQPALPDAPPPSADWLLCDPADELPVKGASAAALSRVRLKGSYRSEAAAVMLTSSPSREDIQRMHTELQPMTTEPRAAARHTRAATSAASPLARTLSASLRSSLRPASRAGGDSGSEAASRLGTASSSVGTRRTLSPARSAAASRSVEGPEMPVASRFLHSSASSAALSSRPSSRGLSPTRAALDASAARDRSLSSSASSPQILSVHARTQSGVSTVSAAAGPSESSTRSSSAAAAAAREQLQQAKAAAKQFLAASAASSVSSAAPVAAPSAGTWASARPRVAAAAASFAPTVAGGVGLDARGRPQLMWAPYTFTQNPASALVDHSSAAHLKRAKPFPHTQGR